MNIACSINKGKSENDGKVLHYCRLKQASFHPLEVLEAFRNTYSPHFLLESADEDKSSSRYTVIGLGAQNFWKCEGNKSYTSSDGKNYSIQQEDNSLTNLKNLIRNNKIDLDKELPPMASGLFGYIGYDCIRLIEDIPNTNQDELDIPDAMLFEPELLVIFDSQNSELFITQKIEPQQVEQSEKLFSNIAQQISKIKANNKTFAKDSEVDLDFKSNYTQEEFEQIVIKAKEYIVEGDIFQIVPSQRLAADYKNDHFDFYKVLRVLNPSPFLFYINFGEFTISGSSPEILVRLRNGKVTIKPLAGTIKRGSTPQEDADNKTKLLNDKKEIAEHLMLLDLGRNDVGRVCKGGEVEVTKHMEVEKYSHVMHISSTVEGYIDSNKHDAVDALLSGFPAGTTSGAPKVRAMEIIDELENIQRKFYSGAVGYFNGDQMDSCIALRTALFKDNKMYVQAGAGVVYDSDPTSEYEETINKAKALTKAASISLKK